MSELDIPDGWTYYRKWVHKSYRSSYRDKLHVFKHPELRISKIYSGRDNTYEQALNQFRQWHYENYGKDF